MKSILLNSAATAVFACAFTPAVLAADQVSDQPAGTVYNPTPSIEEELVYLRDVIALQTIRLDEAEETLQRQNALIEAQANQLNIQTGQINALVATVSQIQSNPNATVAQFGGQYRVQAGDTLGKIARQTGTSINALAAANGLRSPYPLSIGQTLTVPGQATPQAPASAVMAQAQPAPTQTKVAQASPDETSRTTDTAQDKTQNTRNDQPQREEQPNRPVAVASNATADRRRDNDRRDDKDPSDSGVEEVGIRPEDEDDRPYVSLFTDVGGILTPKGTFYVEPSVDYTVSADNRFFFQGIEIADAVLIGAIEASDSSRRAITESIALRYGVTDRLEIDGRISYVSRDDRITGVAIDDSTATLRELSGDGIGDAEMGIHYQLNNGKTFPYTVANLRVKSPSGTGPFDVARDANTGLETELATGSGFWTVEPSLTFILPSDPAVLFANVGYQANLSVSPDEMIGPDNIIREFKPGDALRTSIGVGLSLNEKLSINFGYDQSYFFRTETITEVQTDAGPVLLLSEQPTTTIGSFLFGASYAVNDKFRLNFGSSVGATDQAADARVSLRAQYLLFD